MRNRIMSSQADQCDYSFDSLDTASEIHRANSTVEHEICLFGPERYEPKYQYPLVVWLHSCHSSEAELENVMPELSMQNYVGCAPRAPLASDCGKGRFVWGSSNTATAIAEEIVFSSIETANQHFSMNQQRVFLAGFGSGATMALRLALRYPEKFAGVLGICGRFPNEERTLSRLHQAKRLPILWIYGENSASCNASTVCDTLPLLHSAGLTIDIRQYCCGDELLSNMLQDSNLWLMEHVTNQSTPIENLKQIQFSQN